MARIVLDGAIKDARKLQSSEGFHRMVGGSIRSICISYISATGIGKFPSCFPVGLGLWVLLVVVTDANNHRPPMRAGIWWLCG